MRRLPEVVDCWYDPGAMPFAQWGYPHQNREKFASQFPADFISEATDQTRGWFYSLLAIATLMKDDLGPQAAQYPIPFRACIVLGLMLGEDGGKMSKSKRNYREPSQIFDRYGADALRWYFFANQPPWSSIRYSEQAIKDSIPEFLLRLWNVYSFFVIYASIDGFNPAASIGGDAGLDPRLDDREQLALKESPAPPLSETAAGSGAPGRPPALARESRPMRLTLVIGHNEKRGRAFAEKERPGSDDDKPAKDSRATSMPVPESKTLSPPVASQPAAPAGPSTAGKGVTSSRSKAAETPPGETDPADTRLERDDGALRTYARYKETESSAGGTAPPDVQRKRETMKASKAPSEIRMLVQQVGGVVETTSVGECAIPSSPAGRG